MYMCNNYNFAGISISIEYQLCTTYYMSHMLASCQLGVISFLLYAYQIPAFSAFIIRLSDNGNEPGNGNEPDGAREAKVV